MSVYVYMPGFPLVLKFPAEMNTQKICDLVMTKRGSTNPVLNLGGESESISVDLAKIPLFIVNRTEPPPDNDAVVASLGPALLH